MAGSDLIPELHKSNSTKNTLQQILLIIAGFLLIFFTTIDHSTVHDHDHAEEDHTLELHPNELDHEDHSGHNHD